VGNAVKIGLGTTLVGLGIGAIALIYDFFTTPFLGESTSKGRLLRLRGKARLPDVTPGRGWADDATPRVAHLTAAERRTLADAWLLSARMEHASIPAFAQLSLHLAALGAPSDLVERTHTAALDELRHARRCFAMANAYAGTSYTAGPIVELATPDRTTPIDHVRLAVGSLVDGCLAEGIASDVAALGAGRAEDPVVRDTLAMIAADEAQHAELAWSVLAWCLDTNSAHVHAAVSARAQRLSDELAPRVPDFTGVDRLAAHGLFDQATLDTIARARITAVSTRVTSLLSPARLAA
ncbi:MAG TPA: ferritin-like domain-containing protein, partial [Kofleriaceae bacterium]|nr:ferritin-like domain-containing protein [Kofleriaceae bacterium]